jgi:mediator of RNA polymerase II transcription subunit 7
LNFLELTGILSQSPSDAEAKIQDLRTLFINVHHILNEYRPHQARESAIELMQDHLDRTRTETVAIRTQVDKARRVLEGLGSLGIMDTAVAVGKGEAERKADEERSSEMLRIEREAEVWAIADAACA